MGALPKGEQWAVIKAPNPVAQKVAGEFSRFLQEMPPQSDMPSVTAYYVQALNHILFTDNNAIEVIKLTQEPTIYPIISAAFGALGTISAIQTALNEYISGMILPELFSEEDNAEFTQRVITIIQECIESNLQAQGLSRGFLIQDSSPFVFDQYPIDRREEIATYFQIMNRFAHDCGIELYRGGFDQII